MTIPELMRTISEILTTTEELLKEEGSEKDVSQMLASFLRSLLVDLDKLLVDQGPTGVQPQRRSTRAHMDCSSTTCLVGRESECPHFLPANARANGNRRVKRPAYVQSDGTNLIVNKYQGRCVHCGDAVAPQEGFVRPPGAQSGKWHTICARHRDLTGVPGR